jgi:hypothetical protein
MKVITKYVADDGREFTSVIQCENYEAREAVIKARLDEALRLLAPRPTNIEFTNGKGYLQHDLASVLLVREEVCKLANEAMPHKWFTDAIESGFGTHWSWPARLIDEMDCKPLRDASHRLYCTDPHGREWGQPFYAMNEGKGAEHVCLNPGASA